MGLAAPGTDNMGLFKNALIFSAKKGFPALEACWGEAYAPVLAMKPVIMQGAKMLGTMERDHGIAHLKPEWGLKLSIYQQENQGDVPLFLAEFSVASGWIFHEENLAKVKPGLTGTALSSAIKG